MSERNNLWATIKEYSIPYFSHTYHTKLSAEDIKTRMLQHVNTESTSIFGNVFESNNTSNGTYRGKYEGNTFKIRRIKKGKKSNRPVIVGTVSPHLNTTEVHVVMRLQYYNYIGVVVWLCVMSYILFENGSEIDFSKINYFFFIAAILFGYVITTIGFNREATKTKKFLHQVLETISANNQDNWIIRN